MAARVASIMLTLLSFACGSASSPPAAADEAGSHAGHHPEGNAGHHAPGELHSPHAHHHDFSDVERYAEMFDSPERDAWQRPAEVVERLEIEPGMTVVDLGAGTGYFLPHLANAASDVRVIGLDVEAAMVEHMRERIATEGLAGVEARTCAPDDPGLAPRSVDRILIVNTWHHIEDRAAYTRKLAAALRPGGFVAIVDFTMEADHGPPPAMRLSPARVEAELAAGGLEANTISETLPDQYIVVGRAPSTPQSRARLAGQDVPE